MEINLKEDLSMEEPGALSAEKFHKRVMLFYVVEVLLLAIFLIYTGTDIGIIAPVVIASLLGLVMGMHWLGYKLSKRGDNLARHYSNIVGLLMIFLIPAPMIAFPGMVLLGYTKKWKDDLANTESN